jgi:hypothetical protein
MAHTSAGEQIGARGEFGLRVGDRVAPAAGSWQERAPSDQPPRGGARQRIGSATHDRGEAQRIAKKSQDDSSGARDDGFVEAPARSTNAGNFAIGNKDDPPSSTVKDFFRSCRRGASFDGGTKRRAPDGIPAALN